MQFTRTTLALAAAFGLAVSVAPGVAAAGQTPMITAQAQQQQQQQQQQSFSDDKLRSFASAAVEVREIREDHAQKIEGVTDEDEHAKIVDETIQKMTAAVEDEPGITVEEYNQINQASQNDQELAQKIQTYLQEAE